MKSLQRAIRLVRPVLKRAYLELWRFQHSSSGNTHLSGAHARKRRIPLDLDYVFLRPTESDTARVQEYVSKIYSERSYLHCSVKANSPTVLVDLGANIGLSSLSLMKEFDSVRRVYAIEAELQNFEILKMNFQLWSEKYPEVEWVAIHAVASHSVDEALYLNRSLHDLTDTYSASGTFRYTTLTPDMEGATRLENVLSVSELINSMPEDELIIVKIDIEGGEEHLFKSSTEWLSRCSLVTVEVHDQFHPEMLNSSRLMMEALVANNFAFVPSGGILHCYNRAQISAG